MTLTTRQRWRRSSALGLGALLFCMMHPLMGFAQAALSHGVAMHGAPALAPNFDHFPYATPNAPKGGRITYGFVGTFDSLNPFIVQGNAPRGLSDALYGNNVFETLMVRSSDEPFSLYGLVASSIDMPEDRSWVEFHLNPKAQFSDGVPITVEDVVFTIDLLKTKGRPLYRPRFEKIAKVETTGTDTIRFTFTSEADRELPLLIAGYTPILPKHAIDAATFDQSSLKPMIGSGPYIISKVDPGSGVTLRRNPAYWGRDLPVKKGFDNYGEIRIDYYRDANSYFEAFKAGAIDINFESDPARWSTGYEFLGVKSGQVVKDVVQDGTPKGMNGFVFNIRKPLFQNIKVREALTLLFDFEWVNKNLYFGLFTRSGSFFQGSSLAGYGKPADAAERALLAPYQDLVLPSVMDGTYAPPKSDGSGRDRVNLRKSLDLFAQAGYELKNGVLTSKADGTPFKFEFMVQTREQERLALAYQSSLKLIGVEMSVRLVDSTQYFDRQKKFDFEMMQMAWPASLSPGNEQSFRWSVAAADVEGSYNMAGIKNKGVDAMIAVLLAAHERPAFEAAVRALDRLLISEEIVVPLFHLGQGWSARWARIERPDVVPLYGLQPTTWWVHQ